LLYQNHSTMTQITDTSFKGQRDMNQQETLDLLKRYGMKFLSWAPRNFQAIGKKALRFNVSGHHHKGHVYISVNGSDLYDVHLTSLQGTVKEEIKDLYFDQLFDAIDKKVEWIPEYKD
jgi:hypothetical protein